MIAEEFNQIRQNGEKVLEDRRKVFDKENEYIKFLINKGKADVPSHKNDSPEKSNIASRNFSQKNIRSQPSASINLKIQTKNQIPETTIEDSSQKSSLSKKRRKKKKG